MAPQPSTLTSLPRIEDLPVSESGYDQDRVREAFDAFRRHALQLQAQLRVLQAAGGTWVDEGGFAQLLYRFAPRWATAGSAEYVTARAGNPESRRARACVRDCATRRTQFALPAQCRSRSQPHPDRQDSLRDPLGFAFFQKCRDASRPSALRRQAANASVIGLP